MHWGDCDPWGVALYPRFFEWFEVGAQAVAHAIGLPRRSAFTPTLTALRVERVEVEMLGAARLYEALDVQTWIEEIGASHLALRHEVVRVTDGTLLARGRERRGLLQRDPADSVVAHPRPFADDVRAAAERLIAPGR